ncbi:MAG: DUF6356 family protein [Halobacteriovoraceae bacterium]|nr:DUF6356 family protein [Halobacteriovoraceae bacterium]
MRLIKRSREHLAIVNESYLKHGIPVIRVGFHVLWLGLAFIIHGIVPAIFPFYASRRILRLAQRIKDRNIPEEQEKIVA